VKSEAFCKFLVSGFFDISVISEHLPIKMKNASLQEIANATSLTIFSQKIKIQNG